MTTHALHLVRRATTVAAALVAFAAVAPSVASAYGWPVEPFDRQHPVRGFFGDPRIGDADHSTSFHFGVDVVAANGTPVYATLSGRASIHPLHRDTVEVSDGRGHVYSYWHVVPSIRTGNRVVAYRTVIGRVEAPWAHVHFSEAWNGRYVNPLRRNAMSPYRDDTRPEARSVIAEGRGTPFRAHRAAGTVDLVAEIYDSMPMAAPSPWAGKPVMPAVVRWRILRGDRTATRWVTALDLTFGLPVAAYDRVYARWTRQNKPWRPGRYRVFLVRGLDTRRFADGDYTVEVVVTDTRGNTGRLRAPLVIGNETGTGR